MGRNIDSEEETKAVTLEAAKDHRKDRKSKKSKNVNIVLNSENGAEADGHDEVSKKKRKKERNGVENEGVDGDDETRSVDVSEKRKKEEEINGVKNGEEMLNCENGSNEKEVNGVVVSGKGSGDLNYAALKTFAEARLHVNVIECCKGFSKPSPIQAHSWPFLLDGRDLIGIAATGSAFGVPALMHVLKKKGKESLKKEIPRCLVLSPTRELAQQISDVLCDAEKTCGVKTVCVYGGTSKAKLLLDV